MEEEKEVNKQEVNATSTEKFTWRDGIQIVFLIVLIIAIAALIGAIITIYKYKDLISNPVGENLDRFGINSCMCYNKEGQQLYIKSTNYSESIDLFLTDSFPNSPSVNLNNLTITE